MTKNNEHNNCAEGAIHVSEGNISRCKATFHYIIIGAGRSGIAAAKLLEELGESYALYDGNVNIDKNALKKAIGVEELTLLTGDVDENELKKFDICVVSPGVPLTVSVMQKIKALSIPIWSEIELAFRHDKGTVLAITGTNGKTTTTSLTHEIMKAFNEHTLLVGNIEIPYTGLCLQSRSDGFTVAEISSFQLETMLTFKPHVSAVLNITPDHLDRHGSMNEYERLKKSITKNQDENDFAVLNYEDKVLREFAPDCPCKVVFFSSERELENGWFLRGGDIILSQNGAECKLLSMRETNLVGRHNAENIMAAAAIAFCVGTPLELIADVCRRFVAVEHRIEFVREVNGVKYYNDSKGTNTDAAIKAIDAMPSQTVLIAGGYDKHADYREWLSHLPGKCKRLLLMGQTAQNIAAECDEIGFSSYEFVEDMPHAVRRSFEEAENGDCVLLSPACASWGMFKNYQQRGNIFKDEVKALG